MRNRIFGAAAIFFLWSLFASCSNFFKKDIKEGVIEFKAEAVGPKEHASMTVPDKMTVKFKDNYSAAELEAGFGFARMKFISDPVKKQFYSQVVFVDKKQSVMDMDEIRKTNYYFPDYDVIYGNGTREIAGYKCKNATLKFKDGSDPIEVWYTKDIAIKDPNWSNAYYKVDGVLMDYRLKKFGLELHFTATSVTDAKIDQSYFCVPPDFGKVRNAELEAMFKGFYD
ncbi:MAG TPA: hypothetical protein VFU15_00955 [Bacteroidia bacterium]|nr:hypothetical protein [Bacteroidia bacterium]